MTPIFGKRYQFKTWQIEITSRCGLLCKMCPKWVEGKHDARDMSLDDLRKISVYLPKVESVILEGWGESLLHPNLIEIIEIVKSKGPKAGFVTSGYGLNEKYILDLLRVGIDFIGFSFSGANSKTHESIRKGSSFEELKGGIVLFRELAKRYGLKIPKMHIVFLLLRENIEEAPDMVRLAKSLGIEDLIFINIIHISSEFQNELKVFSYSESSENETFLRKAEDLAKKERIRLRTPSLTMKETLICPENPLRSIYVGVDGSLSPCVYANPPSSSPFVRFFMDKRQVMDKLIFGNLFKESLEEIWRKEDYVEFRKSHEERESLAREMFLSLTELRRVHHKKVPDPPPYCKTCHKMYGF